MSPFYFPPELIVDTIETINLNASDAVLNIYFLSTTNSVVELLYAYYLSEQDYNRHIKYLYEYIVYNHDIFEYQDNQISKLLYSGYNDVDILQWFVHTFHALADINLLDSILEFGKYKTIRWYYKKMVGADYKSIVKQKFVGANKYENTLRYCNFNSLGYLKWIYHTFGIYREMIEKDQFAILRQSYGESYPNKCVLRKTRWLINNFKITDSEILQCFDTQGLIKTVKQLVKLPIPEWMLVEYVDKN
jgi:hypothetical protein